MSAAPNVVGVFAASPTQQAMLSGHDAARDFVSQVVVPLTGSLDLMCFRQAWTETFRRHAVLRTGFVRDASDQTVQFVVEAVDLPLVVWSAEAAGALAGRLADERARGFEPAAPPLTRLALWSEGPDRHGLAWTHHHAILDGWSLQLLLAETLETYQSLRDGSQPNLAAPTGFDSYLRWLRQRDAAPDQAFWAGHLAGWCAPVPIGSGAPGGTHPPGPLASEADRFRSIDHDAGPRLASRLHQAARRWRVTPALLVQGAWAGALAHLSGRDDVVLGITRAGRPASLPDSDRIAGPFLLTPPLRLPLPPALPLATWVHDAARQATEVEAHAHLAPPLIRAHSQVPPGRALFESVVVVQNYASGTRALSGGGLTLDIDRLRVEGGEGGFPLLVSASVDDTLHLKVRYDRQQLEATDVEAALQALLALLEGLAEAADGLLGLEPTGGVGSATATVADWLARAPAHSAGLWARPDGRTPQAAPGEAPQGSAEMRVAAVWSRIVGRPVHRDEDFLAVGGHSLQAIELGTALTAALGQTVTLQLLYAHRTVRGLAAALEALPESAPLETRPADGRTALCPQPQARHEPFPLTALQRAYWIGRQASLALGGRGSFATVEVRLPPEIDAARIEAGWQRLVARHPMLRAVLTPEGLQRVPAAAGPPAPLPCVSVPEAQRHDTLAALRQSLQAQVQDVHHGPLFAVALSRHADGRHHLHAAYDPIVCDAGSFRLLAAELGALARTPDLALPPIDLDFRDYVLACEALATGPAGARDRRYWERRLDSLPPAPDLPVRLEQDGQERFTRRQLWLAPEAWSALGACAARLGATPSALLIAAFGLVVAGWARSRHFCLNLTLFNRQPLHPDVQRLVGDFTTLTLLETDLREARTLAEATMGVQAQLAADLDHRGTDGVDVLRWLSGRQGGQPVLMPVVFTSLLGQTGPQDPEMVLGEVVAGYGQTPQVYLDCQVMEEGGALHGWWDSLDSVFPAGMLDEMFAAFERLLVRTAGEPARIDQEPTLIPEETRRIRAALNATAQPLSDATLHGLFLAQAARTPHAPALIAPEGSLTYGQLDLACARLAGRIRTLAGPAGLVAVWTPLATEQAVASLAVLRAGLTLVRLSPDWPLARCEAVLRITGARLMLAPPDTPPLGDPALERMAINTGLGAGPDDGATTPPPSNHARPDDLAYVMFTSGSTGEPKGIEMTHRAAVNTVLDVNMRLRAGPRDRVLALSAATFDLSIHDLFGLLAVGGAAVYVAPADRQDPARWLDAMSRHEVTLWNSTPGLMEMLVEHLAARETPPLPPLRAAMLSGDWIPVPLADRMRAFWPALRVIGLGGATEAAIWSVWHEIGPPLPGWPSVPYGAPLANQSTHVLDSQRQPRPDWAIGDLYLGGEGLARGYFGRPDLSKASFIDHPGLGERLYRTGDLARFRPGGLLEFLGREDGQVKLRGHRIELGEIEFHLGRLAGVAQAAVVMDHHALRGFFVADAAGPTPDPARARALLAEVLPAYAVPATVEEVAALPLTPNGKVDRARLCALHRPVSRRPVAAAPAAVTTEATATAAPLDDPLTATVLRIVREVLQSGEIDADDDLFLAGGDSVSAVQVAARLRAATCCTVELATVFSLRSPRALADGLRGQASRAVDVIPPHPERGPVPASSMQQRLWLLDRQQPGDVRYIIPGRIGLRPGADLVAVREALSALVARHAALRTVLRHTRDGLVQEVLPPSAVGIEVLPGVHDEAGLAARTTAWALAPFDLAGQAPARFRLCRLQDGGGVLQFALHHAAMDAWSMGLLMQDLAGLYAERRGQGAAPEAPALRYADFAHWEQRQLASPAVAAMRTWWREALRGLPPQGFPSTLPAAAAVPDAVVIDIALDADTTQALRACAERGGATLYMVLLGLFAATLHRFGAPSDLAIASSTNGRVRPELERVVGCFVNLVLVRVQVGDDPTLDELTRRVRHFALEAIARQEVPVESQLAMVRDPGAGSAGGGGRAGAPYTAVFVLQNNPVRPTQAPDLDLSLQDLTLDNSRYPLHLHLRETDDGLRGALRGEGAPLSAARLTALAGHFARLAAAAARQPGRGLAAWLDTDGPARQDTRAAQQQRLAELLGRAATPADVAGHGPRQASGPVSGEAP